MATGGDDPCTPARRSTRSSSAAAAAATPSKPSAPPPPAPSISGDLLLPQEPDASLEALLTSLPGRRQEILDLLRFIGPLNSPTPPILLYGGPSTGKTNTVLRVLRHLRRPFAYVSCRSCHGPRSLFEGVLNQLLLHRRNRENGYSSAKRCDRASEFVTLLRDALNKVIGVLRDGKKKSCSKETPKEEIGDVIYLVFDNVELIRSWDKSSAVLPLLFRISDLLKIPQLGIIYISSATPDAYYSFTGEMEPISVYFPCYTVDDLHNIFMRNQANPKLYASFLSIVLKPFFRVTRRIDELATILELLFHKYCEPLPDLSVVPDESMKRKLYNHLKPHLAASLNETFEVLPWSSEVNDKAKIAKRVNVPKPGGREGSSDLDFHMSLSAKYLLISAFLASRNPATLDAAMFDSTGGSNTKRKRKSSQTSIDHKDDMAEELLMKGPGSFPLERLLAIYQCITSVSECVLDEAQQTDGNSFGTSVSLFMSDVLLQLSTLCNANFLYKSNSCPLEGSSRYRSMIDEDMALKVARSINFPLSKYLYRR